MKKMNMDNLFDEEFGELLGDRLGIDSTMMELNEFNTGDINIEVSRYVTMPDLGDEYEYSENDQIPGYHVSINPIYIENYTYLFMEVTLPTKGSTVTQLNILGIDGSKEYYLSNSKELGDFISITFNDSKEYKEIIKRLNNIKV